MNKTLSFIGLDFKLIQSYKTTFLIIIAMGVVMGASMKSTVGRWGCGYGTTRRTRGWGRTRPIPLWES